MPLNKETKTNLIKNYSLTTRYSLMWYPGHPFFGGCFVYDRLISPGYLSDKLSLDNIELVHIVINDLE